MKNNRFAPVYNEQQQVINCVQTMINQSVQKAELVINIGFNGTDYSSSTEWLITTADNNECILPFCVTPQNPTFISAVAGSEITKNDKGQINITYNDKPAILVTHNGEEYNFAPGEQIRLRIANGAIGFVGNDCSVAVRILPDVVVYKLMTDPKTAFAQFTNNKVQSYVPNRP